MNFTFSETTFAPTVKINLDQNESVKIERGSMVYHNGLVNIEGKTNGGLMKSIGRSLTSGESMFITTATGISNGGQISIAPNSLGTIKKLFCHEDKQWILNDGAFLASDTSVEYEMVRTGSIGKALFSGAGGFFNMHTKGEGDILVNGFGDIEEIKLTSDQTFVCDNYHALAWSSNLHFELKVASGTFGFLSGEGLVLSFIGNGSVFVQTRQLSSFATSLAKFIPSK